jgi:hypothetical protein
MRLFHRWPAGLLVLLALTVPAFTAIGCGSPSAANIALRKQLQQRDDQITFLDRQHQGDLADLRAARGPTTTSLAPDEIAKLFTTHGLAFGRLTGGSDFDSNKPGDQGLKIYVVPTDDDGQPLKAAGSFTVQAFDLSQPDNLIGKWTFDLGAAKSSWYGQAMLYTYVLACPWQQRVPSNPQLTVRVTFHDELTGREFTAQKIVNINPPPPATPASQP